MKEQIRRVFGQYRWRQIGDLDLPRYGGQEVKPLFEVHTPLG
jgi:hypothetical protein